jgi:hypothetical protein
MDVITLIIVKGGSIMWNVRKQDGVKLQIQESTKHNL